MATIVGLTGGIGSGKSTVCRMFADRGAVVIDADAIVHELQRPGTVVFDEMVEAFGPEIVREDGELDRPKVASIVFNDEEQRQQLNRIVHPRVGEEVAKRLAEAGDGVVILDIPLLAESPRSDEARYGEVIVVDVSPDVQLERLIERGMDPDDARSRIATQASRQDRLALADHVIDNDGSLDDLERQVDEVWAKLGGSDA